MYVLDTNIVIYFFKGMGKVSAALMSKPPEEIALPAIVLYELEVGAVKSTHPKKRRNQLGSFISGIEILPFAEREAEIAAKIRANLERKGTPIGPYDVLIAATALSFDAVLVTHNTKEFSRIDGLQFEDWF